MNFFTNKLRITFLFNYKYFFINLFSLGAFCSFIMMKFFNYNISIFFIISFIVFAFSALLFKIFPHFFYIYKNNLNPSFYNKGNKEDTGNSNTIIEYCLLNDKILRLNNNGSYHNELLPTIEIGNKKLFRYKDKFLPFDSVEDFNKIAPIQDRIDKF